MVNVLYGQDTGQKHTEWSKELTQYELDCQMCMDMKSRVNAGENISRREVEGLINSFLTRNKSIKTNLLQLTCIQRNRFEAINEWFRSGEKPDSLPSEIHIDPVVFEAQDTVISASHHPTIIYPAIVLKPTEKSWRYSILATCNVTVPGYGVSASVQYGKWGGHIKVLNSFRTAKSEYSCNTNGYLETGGAFWGNGKSLRKYGIYNIGPQVSLAKWVDLYIGAGYGYDTLFWQDIDGKWANVKGYSFSGLSVDAGIVFSIKRISFGLGCSTIAFDKAYFDLSIGVNL